MRNCIICGKGMLEKAEDITLEIESYVFIVKGERCTGCNEEIPYEEETQRIMTAARLLAKQS